MWGIILGGLLGGAIRGMVGIAKSLILKKDEQINYGWFFVSVAVAMFIGVMAASFMGGGFEIALLSGYAGTDILESLVKLKFKQKKETIINYNFTGAADAGSHQSDIVKNGQIIFSVAEDNSSIIPADTGNGFYVEWSNGDFGSPRCCAEGKMRTRFVWRDNGFVPLYEQEIRYLKIGKGEN